MTTWRDVGLYVALVSFIVGFVHLVLGDDARAAYFMAQASVLLLIRDSNTRP